MKDQEMESLKKLLGKELTDEEVQEIARTFPDLEEDSWKIHQRFQSLKEESPHALSTTFKENILNKLSSRKSFLTWPRITLAAGALAAGLMAITLFPKLQSPDLQPGLHVMAVQENEGQEKQFKVRIAIKQPQARQVALMGDFTQWRKITLTKASNGFHWAELTLPEGNYAYGFLVDGLQWTPDPQGAQKIPDGFGGQNSLVSL